MSFRLKLIPDLSRCAKRTVRTRSLTLNEGMCWLIKVEVLEFPHRLIFFHSHFQSCSVSFLDFSQTFHTLGFKIVTLRYASEHVYQEFIMTLISQTLHCNSLNLYSGFSFRLFQSCEFISFFVCLQHATLDRVFKLYQQISQGMLLSEKCILVASVILKLDIFYGSIQYCYKSENIPNHDRRCMV